MQYILQTPDGKEIPFYVKAVAELFHTLLGGTLVTKESP